MYLPKRYFSGLSQTKRAIRKRELTKRSKLSWKDQNAYRPFKTDKGVKTRKSKYTLAWQKKFPKSKSLEEMSESSGVPIRYLKDVFNRAKAAWTHGHRVGATAEQWGYARVRSFLLKGKTYYTADSDLVKKAKKTEKARRWFNKTRKH